MTDNEYIEKVHNWQKSMIEKYGYYTHYVLCENSNYINCHTHGLPETHSIPDLQIVYAIGDKAAANIIDAVINLLMSGRIHILEDYSNTSQEYVLEIKGIDTKYVPIKLIYKNDLGDNGVIHKCLRIILTEYDELTQINFDTETKE